MDYDEWEKQNRFIDAHKDLYDAIGGTVENMYDDVDGADLVKRMMQRDRPDLFISESERRRKAEEEERSRLEAEERQRKETIACAEDLLDKAKQQTMFGANLNHARAIIAEAESLIQNKKHREAVNLLEKNMTGKQKQEKLLPRVYMTLIHG